MIEALESGEAYVVVTASFDTNLKVGDKIIVNAEDYARSSDNEELAYRTPKGMTGKTLRKHLKAQI